MLSSTLKPTVPSSVPMTPPVIAHECRALIGFDIGGTKCAVSRVHEGSLLEVKRIPTGDFAATFDALTNAVRPFVTPTTIFGISCGGPLDARRGIIVSPPNLQSSWHGVEICALLEATLGGRAILMNDANACALAEWQCGAGRG